MSNLDTVMAKLKEELAKTEARLKEGGNKMVVSGPGGPIGIGIIKTLVEVIEVQAEEIEELKRNLGGTDTCPACKGTGNQPPEQYATGAGGSITGRTDLACQTCGGTGKKTR